MSDSQPALLFIFLLLFSNSASASVYGSERANYVKPFSMAAAALNSIFYVLFLALIIATFLGCIFLLVCGRSLLLRHYRKELDTDQKNRSNRSHFSNLSTETNAISENEREFDLMALERQLSDEYDPLRTGACCGCGKKFGLNDGIMGSLIAALLTACFLVFVVAIL